MDFKKKVRVYFDQGDPARIAFHGQHTLIAQRVLEEYVEYLGIPWKEWFDNRDFFFPVAQFNISFKKPLYPGREYDVSAQFVRLGRTSIEANYKIFNSKKELCCNITAVYVCVGLNNFKPMPFPKRWIPLLKKSLRPN